MAGSINVNEALPNNNGIHENEMNKMDGDDSHLVDEILNELNDGGDLQNQNQSMNNIDPQLNPEPPVHHSEPTIEIMEKTPELPSPVQNIEFEPEQSKVESILEKLKKPVLIACLVFIIFNPLVLSTLSNSIPRLFGPTENLFIRQGRTLLLAILVGSLYLGSSFLM